MPRPTLFDHPKFLRLVYLLQMPEPHVLGHLEYLWKVGYASGNPVVGDETDVEIAAKWSGERGVLATALLQVGLVDRLEDGRLQIHDLLENAPDYVHARFRMNEFRKRKRKESSQYSEPLRNRYASPTPTPTHSSSAAAEPNEAMKPTTGNPEAEQMVQELKKRGLSCALAGQLVQTADPALIREAIAFFDSGQVKPQKPAAFLRSLIEKPAKWGFEQTPDGWKAPGDGKPPCETAEQRAARLAQESQQYQTFAAQADRDRTEVRELLKGRKKKGAVNGDEHTERP